MVHRWLCAVFRHHVQDKSAGMMGMGKGMLGKGMDETPLGEVRRAGNPAADRRFLEQGVEGFVVLSWNFANKHVQVLSLAVNGRYSLHAMRYCLLDR